METLLGEKIIASRPLGGGSIGRSQVVTLESGPKFYQSYNQVLPPRPGHPKRESLYQLYHYLNHLNLFGTSYLAPVRKILSEFK